MVIIHDSKCRYWVIKRHKTQAHAILVYRQEVKRIRKANYIKASINAPFFASAKLIVYVTFLAYILSGNFITAEKVRKQSKIDCSCTYVIHLMKWYSVGLTELSKFMKLAVITLIKRCLIWVFCL